MPIVALRAESSPSLVGQFPQPSYCWTMVMTAYPLSSGVDGSVNPKKSRNPPGDSGFPTVTKVTSPWRAAVAP